MRPDDDDPTLGDYLNTWLERRRSQLRPTTLQAYEGVIRNYLRPQLGSARLSELDRRMLESAYARLLAAGGRNGQQLAPRTVASAHWLLHCALNDAKLDGLLDDNPAGHATPPRRGVNATEIDDALRVWSAEDAHAFLRIVDAHPLRALWHLALSTGARRGELLGLRWQDVEVEKGSVVIRRALSVVKGTARLLGTKTSQARRIAIGPSVVDALERHREQQEQSAIAAGDLWRNDWGLVFTNETGRYVGPTSVTTEFKRLVRIHGLPEQNLHGLRHTNASLLLEGGVPMQVISRRLGHARTAIMMDTYAHLMRAMDQEAAATLDELLALARTDDR